MSVNQAIKNLIEEFASKLIAEVESSTTQRIQSVLASAFGAPAKSAPKAARKAVAFAQVVTLPVKRGPGRPKSTAPKAPKVKKVVSPEVARTRKIQGQYLGALRSLNATDKAKVRALAKEKGSAVALKLAQSLKK